MPITIINESSIIFHQTPGKCKNIRSNDIRFFVITFLNKSASAATVTSRTIPINGFRESLKYQES